MRIAELYQEGPESTFTHDGTEYSVDAAIRMADDYEPVTLEVADLEWVLDYDTPVPGRDEFVDKTIPILCTVLDGHIVVVDGLHRLQRAIDDGDETIPAKMLDCEDMERSSLGEAKGDIRRIAGALALGGAIGLAGSHFHGSRQDAPKPAAEIEKPEQKSAPAQKKTDKRAEVYELARTIWGEARSDGSRGMHAIANVIVNRANDAKNAQRGGRLYGNGISGVVRKSSAFSAWNRSGSSDELKNRNLMVTAGDGELTYPDQKAFDAALEIAKRAYSGQLEDITHGATHYYKNPAKPFWKKRGKVTAKIGSHIFLKGVDNG